MIDKQVYEHLKVPVERLSRRDPLRNWTAELSVDKVWGEGNVPEIADVRITNDSVVAAELVLSQVSEGVLVPGKGKVLPRSVIPKEENPSPLELSQQFLHPKDNFRPLWDSTQIILELQLLLNRRLGTGNENTHLPMEPKAFLKPTRLHSLETELTPRPPLNRS